MTEKEYMLTARKIFDSVGRYGSGILDTDDFCMALRFDKNIHSLFKPSLMNGIGGDVKMGNGWTCNIIAWMSFWWNIIKITLTYNKLSVNIDCMCTLLRSYIPKRDVNQFININ